MSVLHTASSWLHIVSLGLWLGGIAFFLAVFGPAVRGLSAGLGARVLDRGRRFFEMISWLAITLLAITGVANMIFRGLGTEFHFREGYYAILAVKLFLFLAMLLHHSFQVFKYSPQIVSLTSQAPSDAASWPEPLLSQWKKWFLLLEINAALGPIVVLLGIGLKS